MEIGVGGMGFRSNFTSRGTFIPWTERASWGWLSVYWNSVAGICAGVGSGNVYSSVFKAKIKGARWPVQKLSGEFCHAGEDYDTC